MACSRCDGFRRVAIETNAQGSEMGDCPECVCRLCGEELVIVPCICDEALKQRCSTAEGWIEAAGDMHLGSMTSPTVALRNRYRVARTFCELKAFEACGKVCTADALRAAVRRADVLAAFEHLMTNEAA